MTSNPDQLKRIELALMALASRTSPSWKRPLQEYKNGWVEKIGAFVISKDEYGPTVVFWMGRHWVRRSNDSKFGKAIWFSASRAGDNGEAVYDRLITFEDSYNPQAEPLPPGILKALGY